MNETYENTNQYAKALLEKHNKVFLNIYSEVQYMFFTIDEYDCLAEIFDISFLNSLISQDFTRVQILHTYKALVSNCCFAAELTIEQLEVFMSLFDLDDFVEQFATYCDLFIFQDITKLDTCVIQQILVDKLSSK